MRRRYGANRGEHCFFYQSSLKHALDERIHAIFLHGMPPVFLPFTVVPISSTSVEVQYCEEGLVSLEAYLTRPLSQDEALRLLCQIKQVVDECSCRGIPLMNVELDTAGVFYDRGAQTIRVVCVPLRGLTPDVSATLGFFANLARLMRPADEGALRVKTAYRDYIASLNSFDPAGISAFISELATDGGIERKKELPEDREMAGEYRRYAGAGTSGESSSSSLGETSCLSDSDTLPPSPLASHSDNQMPPATGVLNAYTWEEALRDATEGEAEPPCPQSCPDAPVYSAVETSQDALDPGTVVLAEEGFSSAPVSNSLFRLTRVSTGERVEIKGEQFVVGKSKYSSFQVREAPTVSRRHAVFTCRGDECLMRDNDSLNGTFVNNRRITGDQCHRLRHGDVIRLSDEEFLFTCERV